jgi:hypothetical protein
MFTKGIHIAIAFLMVIAAAPKAASAQEGGLKAGLNVASLTGDLGYFGGNVEFSGPKRGTSRGDIALAGAWLRVPAGGRVSFQLEALFSEKGFLVTAQGGWLGETLEDGLRLRYLETPLLARIDFTPGRGFLVAGLVPAFKIAADREREFGTPAVTVDVSDDVQGFDLGVGAGAGLTFGRAVLEARYTHGLRPVFKPREGGNVPSLKNRAVSLTVGFRLF